MVIVDELWFLMESRNPLLFVTMENKSTSFRRILVSFQLKQNIPPIFGFEILDIDIDIEIEVEIEVEVEFDIEQGAKGKRIRP